MPARSAQTLVWTTPGAMNTRFSCVGCGKCCTDHHVPLTLSEARQWAADGGALIVLTEGFLDNGYGVDQAQWQHATRRSILVNSGAARAYIAITFAAYNVGPCRNLDAQQLCRIYERRPLVCRIYPMEINPHIPLRPHTKDCPPHAWEQGPELIVGNTLADPQLLALIEQSRQADRDDIAAKRTVCQLLGINTTALKGNGFVAYLPEMSAFSAALEAAHSADAVEQTAAEWRFHVAGQQVSDTLQQAGARLAAPETQPYLFIPLAT